jgi:hypothetical protein
LEVTVPRTRTALKAACLVVLLVAVPARAAGDESAPPAESSQHWRLGAMAGVGSVYHNAYFLFGGRIGYELALGFTLDLEGQWWTGSTPGLFKLAPGLIWYAPIPLLRPYIGAFYAHWFVGSGFADQDAVGWRAGLQVASAGPAAIDVGFAYEHLLSCPADCDSWWPEISAGLRF